MHTLHFTLTHVGALCEMALSSQTSWFTRCVAVCGLNPGTRNGIDRGSNEPLLRFFANNSREKEQIVTNLPMPSDRLLTNFTHPLKITIQSHERSSLSYGVIRIRIGFICIPLIIAVIVIIELVRNTCANWFPENHFQFD